MKIVDPTKDRYSSLALVSTWELSTIQQASALVVGAGALGNEVVKNLAMVGIKRIYVLDYDTVEVANLSRSIFYREKDHGLLKAKVLAKRLKEVNSNVETIPLIGSLEEVLGLGLLRRMDLIFSCLDNRLARRNLNRMCQKIARIWIDGSMENLLGEVVVYLPDYGPCYECYLTKNDREIIAQAFSCKGLAIKNLSFGKVPTTPTMGSIISAVQVQEAFKVLHQDFNVSDGGKKLVFNFQTNDFYRTGKARLSNCEGHFRFGKIIPVQNWNRNKTTPKEILQYFFTDTGERGELLLGREILVGLKCLYCNIEERLTSVLSKVPIEKARCSKCQNIRDVLTTHKITVDDNLSELTLCEIGLPLLEIVEVRSTSHQRWYEISGDFKKLFRSG